MEKKKIKQNKKEVSIIISLVAIIALCVTPVFADTQQLYLPYNESVILGSSTTNAGDHLITATNSSFVKAYINNYGSSGRIFYVSSDPATVHWSFTNDSANGNTILTYNSNYNLYTSDEGFFNINWSHSSPYLMLANSLSDAVSYYGYSYYSGDVVPLTTSYYSLDSGAYYKASENGKAAFALVGDIANGFTVVVGSIDPNCFIYKATDSTVYPISLFRSNNLDLTNFYSNQNAGMIHPSGINLSAFDNAADAETAIYNYLVDEGGTPTATSSYSLSYSLPPGNVMFIDVSSAVGSINLETSSGISVSQNEFNNNNNQTIGYLASFPDSFSLPLSGTADIQWSASGNPTILGTYQKFQYTSAINSGGNQYLVIVNPTYDNLAISEGNLQADNPSATNGYIDIRCSAQNFYIFSLDAQISFSDGSWQLDSESSNTQFTGTYDPTTQTWNITDSITGLPAQPTVGGANDIPTTDPAQAASNFTAWLKNFLSSFISIFDAGKTAITTLVGYAQPFFNTIGSLYSWLPAPVYAVLVSGLTLVVIVGVIKVFL